MEVLRWNLITICVAFLLVQQNASNVEARSHYHKKTAAPSSSSASCSSQLFPVSSTRSNGSGDSCSDHCIFDVKCFGADGDGKSDDTEAFRAAWKAACGVESGILLVPSGHVFTVRSTIFSGPCKPGLVFQVILEDLSTFCLCSIGSLGVHNSQACVSNITVRDTVIRESDNGLRIKTWQGGTGAVSGISFQDIQMQNVRNCIIIDQYYCLSSSCHNQTSAVHVTDVSYRNVKGTYDVRNPPIHFACSDTVACTNITMFEVELLPEEGKLLDDPFCWNAYGTQETLTIPPITCLRDGEPQSVGDSSRRYGC